MTIKKTSLFVILFFLLFNATFSAKNANNISATVKDNKTEKPIEFATVELLSTKDSLISGCITDSKGYFEIPSAVKTSRIRISYIGYKNMVVDLRTNDLGDLLMEEDAKMLGEVSVKASAKQNKIDRDVYAVTKEMKAGTASSQELLGKLNGVNYNRYDKSITVNGSSKILILVDGIEKDQQMAKNLPTERIERVEVIKDPVGKYATEGYTAVINIVLKKDYSGVDALVSNTAFFNVAKCNGDDIFTQDYGSMNVTYTYKTLNIYTSGWGFAGNFNIPAEYVKSYGNTKTETQKLDNDNPNGTVTPKNGQMTFGGDYTFAKKHTISAEIQYSESKDENSFFYNLNNTVNNTTSNSTFENKNDSKTSNLQSTISYKGKYDENNTLDIDFRYRHTGGYNNSWVHQDVFSNTSNIDRSGDYTRANINYNHQFSSKFNMDFGYGNVFNQNVNEQNTSSFTRNEYRNRFSVYLSYKPTPQINTKMGGIVEYYKQSYDGNDKALTSFLPYINIQYTPSSKFNIIAKYHSWADYPTIDQLIPYRAAQDSLMVSVGNPALKTAVYHTLGLDFNIMNFITLSPYYSYDNARIASYVSTDPTNTNHFLTQYINADKYERYGVALNFTLPLAKNIFWQNRYDWYKNKLAYNDESYTTKNFVINSSLIYAQEKSGLVAGLILQKQMSREANIQGYNTNGNDILLALLQKSFLKQKLNIALLYMLPLNYGLSYDQKNLTRTNSYYQYSNSSLNLIKHMAFIEISYHFNAGKEVNKKKANTEDESKSSKKSGIGF